MTSQESSLRRALRSALTAAMKERDRASTSLFRSALAALDNAEAVVAGAEHRSGAVEDSPLGVGAADVRRRELSDVDEARVVRREIAERREAADLLARHHSDRAERLHREADLLERLMVRVADASHSDGPV